MERQQRVHRGENGYAGTYMTAGIEYPILQILVEVIRKSLPGGSCRMTLRLGSSTLDYVPADACGLNSENRLLYKSGTCQQKPTTTSTSDSSAAVDQSTKFADSNSISVV